MAADRKLVSAPPRRARSARIAALGVLALALAAAAPAHAGLAAPQAVAPGSGAVVELLPAFAWTAVPDADHYEFQIAADAGFNSPVLGQGNDDFTTRNTRATLLKTVPNGTYWWRVRAVTANGDVSGWSQGRSLKKSWTTAPALQQPGGGATLSFGTDSLALGWSPVPGAANYLVSVATDPTLGSLIVHDQYDPNNAPKVQASNFAIGGALAQGAYYWSVTPVDAEGNRGVPSPVASFNWQWPSTTTPTVVDLNDALEVFDPKFSWTPVAGAARYEVEINPSQDFAPGSKVCCSSTTINTSLSPTMVFKDNVFYWRVRAIDPDGNAGVWNYGPPFTKTFDKVPPAGPVTGTAIKDLHMRDNATDATVAADSNHDLSDGFQTTAPVASWGPVPGASSYEVVVAAWDAGTATCGWTTPVMTVKTAVTAWTPLGNPAFGANPAGTRYPYPADDVPALPPGSYCLSVRARSDRAGFEEIVGDPTYLRNGNTDSSSPFPQAPAFTWTGYPDPVTAPDGCSGYPCATGYLAPSRESTARSTPLFTWTPVRGANSYFIVVAKDANFSNVIDEAFTRIPAYAPRSWMAPTTYADETTSYYWEVLPATLGDGSNALPIDPFTGSPSNFQKQSIPPTQLFPENGHVFLDQPTFRWTPVLGARTYRFQVAQDPSFGNPIDDITTDSTAYSSDTTYPADTVLYWRVRANDENNVGLTWSATGTFQKKLATPLPSPSNPTTGEYLPVWAWSSVEGAASYDVSIDGPDGQTRNFTDFRMPAGSFQKLTGTGVWHWRVRAEFPKQNYGNVPGPWSPSMPFTRTIGEPTGLKTDGAPDHLLLSWNPKFGVKNYRVQIASRPDFSSTVEDLTTDNTAYAPKLGDIAYLNGGRLYWRVAGVDADSNTGDFTQAQAISLLPHMKLRVAGKLRSRRRSSVTARVTSASGSWLKGVAVRVTGSGVRTQTKGTKAYGSVTFRLRPTRRGRVLFRATKPGYQSEAVVLIAR